MSNRHPYNNDNAMNPMYDSYTSKEPQRSRDYGPWPLVLNIEEITKRNNTFRTVIWTGCHLQLTVMCIRPGEDIGLEMHSNLDQFLYVVCGRGVAKMGERRENLNYQQRVYEGDAIIVPACTWHNIINTGNCPLKLFSIYAPPQHPPGTVHATKADAEAAEKYGRY